MQLNHIVLTSAIVGAALWASVSGCSSSDPASSPPIRRRPTKSCAATARRARTMTGRSAAWCGVAVIDEGRRADGRDPGSSAHDDDHHAASAASATGPDADHRHDDTTAPPPPPPATCTSFIYSAWSACQSNGTQTQDRGLVLPGGLHGRNAGAQPSVRVHGSSRRRSALHAVLRGLPRHEQEGQLGHEHPERDQQEHRRHGLADVPHVRADRRHLRRTVGAARAVARLLAVRPDGSGRVRRDPARGGILPQDDGVGRLRGVRPGADGEVRARTGERAAALLGEAAASSIGSSWTPRSRRKAR